MNVYLYGNCQATALGQMMLEQFPEWTVTSLDVSTLPAIVGERQVARHLRAVEAADIVVSQPVGEFRNEPQLSLQTLRDAMRQDAQLITFPSIVFEGTHGAFTYLEQRLDGYMMPYHNSHTLDMFLRGYSWHDIDLLQASLDFYTADFVEIGMEASLATLRNREALHTTTIRVSPMIDELCRSMIVMNAINHPRRILLTRVLNEIYQTVSVPRKAEEQGEDYLRYPAIPPLATVLHHLGLPDNAPEFRIRKQSWTRKQYMKESLSYYSRQVRPDLMRALVQSRGAAFLHSFHETVLSFDGAGYEALPQTSEAFADAIISEVFEVFLHRSAASVEKEAHLLALRTEGLHKWLDAITAAAEFNQNFHRRSRPE